MGIPATRRFGRASRARGTGNYRDTKKKTASEVTWRLSIIPLPMRSALVGWDLASGQPKIVTTRLAVPSLVRPASNESYTTNVG